MKATDFDATQYWRSRHARYGGLAATGTLGGALPWQHWLYKGKLRAYGRMFARIGFGLKGKRALNFGCGAGYFEDHWERLGAAATAGIDIVPEAIAELQAAHPERKYVCGDLARNPALIDQWGSFDLVTAIDVVYHILDDADVETIFTALAARLAPQGYFLVTDALRDLQPAPHVRFRSQRQLAELLRAAGMRIVTREPVFVTQNRPSIFARLTPRLAGSACYYADALLTRMPRVGANNWALLCAKG